MQAITWVASRSITCRQFTTGVINPAEHHLHAVMYVPDDSFLWDINKLTISHSSGKEPRDNVSQFRQEATRKGNGRGSGDTSVEVGVEVEERGLGWVGLEWGMLEVGGWIRCWRVAAWVAGKDAVMYGRYN